MIYYEIENDLPIPSIEFREDVKKLIKIIGELEVGQSAAFPVAIHILESLRFEQKELFGDKVFIQRLLDKEGNYSKWPSGYNLRVWRIK